MKHRDSSTHGRPWQTQRTNGRDSFSVCLRWSLTLSEKMREKQHGPIGMIRQPLRGFYTDFFFGWEDVRHRAARRRRRPNVGVAPAPFSWRVHVMLYTSYMLLAFCNVVYNEAWTFTERTTRACFATSTWALDTQTKHGGVKAKLFSWTVLWKWKLMLKVSYGTSLVILLIKRVVQWKILTACTVITVYKVAK